MEKNLLDRQFVLDEMEFHKVPGLAVAVVHKDEIILSECYGYKDLEKKTPVTPNTQFGIASCSKAFTSAVIAMLVDEGTLDYDTPIREYMPDFRMYDPRATEEMCLRDMLSHRTGFAGHDALWVDQIDRAEMARRLRYVKPNRPFRSATQYSNVIYTLAGHVAERVTGKSWDELVAERIFKPLGMTNSNTSVESMKKAQDYAMPYWDFEDGRPVQQVPIWNVDLGGPAAGVNSCTKDMIRWVNFHIHHGEWEGRQLISKESMDEMHQPQSVFEKAWPWDYEEILPYCGYGMAWFIEQYRGKRLIWHTGEIEGYCSLQAFLPNEKLGFVMLMNLHKPCALLINTLMYTMIDRICGLEPVDWSARFRGEKGNYGYFYYHWDVDLLPEKPVCGTFLSHRLDAYVGHYFNEGYGDFHIVLEEGNLWGIYRGVRQVMEHYHYDVFKVPRIKEDTILVTAPLSFQTDPYTGGISGFTIKLEPEVEAIEFVRIEGLEVRR